MMFKKHKVTFLNESWKIVKTDVSVKAIPRIHEIVYLVDELKYYRVVNVVHNIDKNHTIYVIIEEYADDYALIEKKSKKNLT